MLWTDDRLAKLTTPELKNLLVNLPVAAKAHRMTEAEAADTCVRIQAMMTKARSNAVRAQRGLRPMTLDRKVAIDLGAFAESLGKRYDLTPETAKSLSAGMKGFRSHNLTAKNGEAKTGGAMKEGKLAIDRYISYRVRDVIVSLAFILFKDEPEENGRFFLVASDEVLSEGESFTELLGGKADYGWSAAFTARMNAMSFTDLATAGAQYEVLIAKLAPAREAAA